MAQIDVSELMSDPDFVDPISVITRVPYVNGKGEQTLTEKVLNSIGSVQPASYKTVQKLPDAMRVANMYQFWFKGEIIASEPGKYSSIVVFKGKRYQVMTVEDWTNFGAGYTAGVCVAEVPA